MKKLKEKVLKTIILLTVVSSTLPFFCHDVYADTISQSDVQGVERVLVNSTYLDQSVTNSGNTYKYYSFDYEVTVLLKDYYLGWIQGVFQTSFKTFDNANWQVQNSSCTTVSKSYYVNDNKFKSSFTITAWVLVNQQGNVDPAGSYTTSFTLSNSNVVAYQNLNSIDTVIDILQDINQYVSIDILDELQDIVTNTALSNTYLETLTKLRQWNFPVESLSPISYLYSYGYEVIDIYNNSYWTYPIFQVPINSVVATKWCSVGYQKYIDFIIIQSVGSMTMNNINTFYSFSNNATVSSLTEISYSPLYSIYKVQLDVRTVSGFVTVTNLRAMNLCTIYFQPYWWKNNSTDFALVYGLSNQLLDDLHIIAQGTQASSSSSSNLEDSSSDFDDVAGDVYNLENSFNTGLNDSLQQIDTSFDVGNQFTSKFLLAADWVRVQFNTITAENPFGTMLSFSLLLGVALLIIGKVLG